MAQYLEHAKRRLDVKHVVGIKEGYLLLNTCGLFICQLGYPQNGKTARHTSLYVTKLTLL